MSWEVLETGVLKLPIDIDWNNQAYAVSWCLLSIVFGFVVLAFDTVQSRERNRSSRMNIRDSIMGLEQRYFLVVINGFLIYAILSAGVCLQPSNGIQKL